MLVSYIYDYSNGKRPIGCMIARKTNRDNIAIGYSLCNPKDKFDKRTARIIAMKSGMPHCPKRDIENYYGDIVPISKAVSEALEKMKDRVQKYYFPKPKMKNEGLVGKWCRFVLYPNTSSQQECVGFVTDDKEGNTLWSLRAEYRRIDKEDEFGSGLFSKEEVVEVY